MSGREMSLREIFLPSIFLPTFGVVAGYGLNCVVLIGSC